MLGICKLQRPLCGVNLVFTGWFTEWKNEDCIHTYGSRSGWLCLSKVKIGVV